MLHNSVNLSLHISYPYVKHFLCIARYKEVNLPTNTGFAGYCLSVKDIDKTLFGTSLNLHHYIYMLENGGDYFT
jgi:hypothetical protein